MADGRGGRSWLSPMGTGTIRDRGYQCGFWRLRVHALSCASGLPVRALQWEQWRGLGHLVSAVTVVGHLHHLHWLLDSPAVKASEVAVGTVKSSVVKAAGVLRKEGHWGSCWLCRRAGADSPVLLCSWISADVAALPISLPICVG